MQARLGRETRRGKAAGRRRPVALCIVLAALLGFAALTTVAILPLWVSLLLAVTATLASCSTCVASYLLRPGNANGSPIRELAESTIEVDLTLRSTIEALPIAVCLANTDGRVQLMNKSMRRLARAWTGSIDSSLDSIGDIFNALASCKTNTDAIESLRQACSDIFAGRQTGFDRVIAIEQPLSCRYLHIRALPVFDRPMRLLICINDVTRQKHFESEAATARRELESSNERAAALARVFAESPLFSFIFDAKSDRILEANASACKALGMDKSQLRERSITDVIEVTTSEIEASAASQLIAACQSGESGGSLLRRDEESLPIAISSQRTRYMGRDALVVMATDLSERSQIQRQLERAQKMEALGQMAAGVTHEINSPVQFISGSVEYLQEATPKVLQVVTTLRDHLSSSQLPEAVEERTRIATTVLDENRFADLQRDIPEAIADCTDGIERVTEIVSAVKAMSHPGTSQAVTIDVNELLRKATVITRSSWKQVGEVVLDLDPELLPIEGHPTDLSQVFVNLIVNAVDAITEFQEQGGQSTSDGVIVVCTALRDDGVLVEVADNGSGMPAELIERVFDPFFTTKEFGKGTGQGLAICRDTIVNKHGGHIDVVSTPGHGTKFSILLPASTTAVANPID